VHCLEDEGKGNKGSEQQAVTKDERERGAVRYGKIVKAKQRRQTRSRERER